MSKANKNPPPIKWRNNPLDYNYPRTSKDAFGFDIGDGELEFPAKGRRGKDVGLLVFVLALFWGAALILVLDL